MQLELTSTASWALRTAVGLSWVAGLFSGRTVLKKDLSVSGCFL